MKKVIVIGCPGSGKSTFARELNRIMGIPVYHLDMMYWNSDRSTVDEETFRKRMFSVMETENWIIDGNYGSTMELRLQKCDTVFFLDYPLEVCLDGIHARKGLARPDIPWVETGEDEEFLDFVRDYETQNKPEVIGLLEKYADKECFVFKCREEASNYLMHLQEKRQ